jgi:hypothetical protein
MAGKFLDIVIWASEQRPEIGMFQQRFRLCSFVDMARKRQAGMRW